MTVALLISVAAAVIPTIVYVLIFYWADRYEREPIWLVLVAFVWGAVPAVVVSLFGELVLGWPWIDAPDNIAGAIIEGAIIAPVVEELAKGVALLLIFLFLQQEFDGVLDGIVYGALIGFGFAMTENFLYFVGAYDEGGFQQLTVVIFLRAVLFGLNHAFYTGLAGIGFGLARLARATWVKWLWIFLGLAMAMLTHSLHNIGASLAAIDITGLGLSLLVAVAGIGLVLVAVLLAWQHERNCIRRELAEEVGTLLTAEDYLYLTERWHNPLHKRGQSARSRAYRMHLYVELAQRKCRLRDANPGEALVILQEVAQIRTQLAALPA
ncbi:MAG: PrsW family intramembrane metalloprotease [Caldilineaceae bacterium]|nr:PrsW family intramembrane metalloprotease [Caldilineaceae bacterium]